jgi:hypothetical protein
MDNDSRQRSTFGYHKSDLHHFGHDEETVSTHVVINTTAGHVLHQDAEVGLPRACPDELHHMLVPHLAHDANLLHVNLMSRQSLQIYRCVLNRYQLLIVSDAFILVHTYGVLTHNLHAPPLALIPYAPLCTSHSSPSHQTSTSKHSASV